MAAKTTGHHYENNPFFIASSGITLLANTAGGVFALLLVLSLISIFSRSSVPDPNESHINGAVATVSTWSTGDWSLALGSGFVITLAFLMIMALLGGVSAYTSARLARGKKVSLREAFGQAFEHLWGYLWLQIIIFVKVVLWSLLLIVPGIIMAVRYSLAGVAFYDDKKNLRGNAAVKESLRLTRGAWITTYASTALFGFLTLGALTSIVSTSANAILYRQFDQVGKKKPAAHWLSWLTLILPFVLLIVLIMFMIMLVITIGVFGIRTL